MKFWRILSAILLFAVAAIHIFLRFDGVGGTLGLLFIVQGVIAIVGGVGMLVAKGGLLRTASALSFLFMIASLAALLLALTVGIFGITEVWTFTLVPGTVVVEAIGIVVLAITTGMLRPARRAV
jgi:hypothetical protein